ncbi:hypothetical protein [Mammaliicoccus sp. Dog046]|uniref:hypothetical protein n=1 Tax=Mammaliicoccus sp. Dog046 TaxID=3034233 RepID=UPI002B261FBD|nr:hypothetical protein [Mammaliicoccus sp. Dog046]WQK84649.1 hypothetical protein P3U32_08390 [Mammaliicoccus sp. Dog046]
MVKLLYIVNIFNYLFLVIGSIIFYIQKLEFADLLYYFFHTSIIAGVISLAFVFSRIKRVRYTGLIRFVMNLVNIFALIPFIIFLLFFII